MYVYVIGVTWRIAILELKINVKEAINGEGREGQMTELRGTRLWRGG